jgi:hypothetical protein
MSQLTKNSPDSDSISDRPFAWSRLARPIWVVAILLVAVAGFQLTRAQAISGITSLLEEPGSGQLVGGIRNIRGWGFSSNGPIVKVEMFIDGVSRLTIPCCGPRSDVQSKVAGAPLDTGFSGVWNWGLVTNGAHTVVVRLTDSAAVTADQTVQVTVKSIQDPGLGGFLSELNLASSTCTRTGDQICCSNVSLTSQHGQQNCTQICYGWDPASQGLITTASNCQPPTIFATPTPVPSTTLTASLCGNGVVDGDEECDTNDLDGWDCDSWVGGSDFCNDAAALKCDASCHIDASECVCPCTGDFDCSIEIDCSAFVDGCDFFGACLDGLCNTSSLATDEICNGLDPNDGDPFPRCGF